MTLRLGDRVGKQVGEGAAAGVEELMEQDHGMICRQNGCRNFSHQLSGSWRSPQQDAGTQATLLAVIGGIRLDGLNDPINDRQTEPRVLGVAAG